MDGEAWIWGCRASYGLCFYEPSSQLMEKRRVDGRAWIWGRRASYGLCCSEPSSQLMEKRRVDGEAWIGGCRFVVRGVEIGATSNRDTEGG